MSKLFNALAKQAAKPFAKEDSNPNIIENSGSSMMLKKIIAKVGKKWSIKKNIFYFWPLLFQKHIYLLFIHEKEN